MYTITVQQTGKRIELKGKEWAAIATKDDGKPEFGYTPLVEKEVEFNIQVYQQSVSELDLPAVIRAVNGMK